jgi:hypothetical protein
MAASPQWLATIGTALRNYSQDITRDPLPKLWVDLIHRLNEEHSRQPAPAPREQDEPN